MVQPLIGVITNPNSRKNRLEPGRYEAMREVVGSLGHVRRTQHTGEIADVVRDFLDEGIPYWVADGGDGAFHWLVNVTWQVLREREAKGSGERGGTEGWPAIMPTNAGTIDFIGRKCSVVGDADGLLRALCRTLRLGRTPDLLTIDSLVVRGIHGADTDWPGRPFEKVGFAAALAGVGQRFFDKFYAQEQQDAAGILKIVAKVIGSGLSQFPVVRHVPLPISLRCYGDTLFEPMPLDVWVDGKPLPMRTFRAVNVGAIDINLAGLFRFFHHASSPGVLHVQAGNPDVLDVLRNIPNMMTGRDLAVEGFFEGPGQTVRIVARDGRRIDPVIDGELYWGLSECDVALGPEVRVVQMRA